MSPDDPRHGTNAGHRAHYKDNEAPCAACKEAHATYQRNRRSRHYLAGTDTLRVPIHSIQRRIRALQAIGWDLANIGRAMGYSDRLTEQELRVRAWNICGRPAAVNLDTFQRVVVAYERLSGKPGPSKRSREWAARRGWAPPLAWDDIDDPDEQPTGHILCARPDCNGEPWALGMCRNHYYADLTARRRQEAS